jgi:hypothetical protein
VSIAAFVAGVVGFIIASVPLGIAGMVRTRSHARRGRGLAIAALPISAVWMVLFALLAAAAAAYLIQRPAQDASASDVQATATPSETPTSSPTAPLTPSVKPVPARMVLFDHVRVGHCIERNPTGVLTRLPVVPCAQGHDHEIFAIVTLPRGAWPGDNVVDERTDRLCVAAFPKYVGVPLEMSELDVSAYTPHKDAWLSGDRRSFCTVYDPNGQALHGSVRGSQR